MVADDARSWRDTEGVEHEKLVQLAEQGVLLCRRDRCVEEEGESGVVEHGRLHGTVVAERKLVELDLAQALVLAAAEISEGVLVAVTQTAHCEL